MSGIEEVVAVGILGWWATRYTYIYIKVLGQPGPSKELNSRSKGARCWGTFLYRREERSKKEGGG